MIFQCIKTNIKTLSIRPGLFPLNFTIHMICQASLCTYKTNTLHFANMSWGTHMDMNMPNITHTHKYRLMHIYPYNMNICVLKCIHTHAYMHMHTHIYTHTHTHTCILNLFVNFENIFTINFLLKTNLTSGIYTSKYFKHMLSLLH